MKKSDEVIVWDDNVGLYGIVQDVIPAHGEVGEKIVVRLDNGYVEVVPSTAVNPVCQDDNEHDIESLQNYMP